MFRHFDQLEIDSGQKILGTGEDLLFILMGISGAYMFQQSIYCSMRLQQGILVGLGGQRGTGAAQEDCRFSLVGEPSEVLA